MSQLLLCLPNRRRLTIMQCTRTHTPPMPGEEFQSMEPMAANADGSAFDSVFGGSSW